MVNALFAVALVCALTGGICQAQPERSAAVSGIVTDAVTRLPIEGAMVQVYGDGRQPQITRTDEFGQYTVDVSPGSRTIWAIRDNYLNPDHRIAAELNAGDTFRQDFRLRPLPRISGIITDADTGARMSGCIVFAMRRILSMGEAWYTAAGIPTADSRSGTFETVGVRPGDYVLEITGCDWSFYPGVSRIEMATPIAVTESGISGLDIKIKRQRHKLSGATGQAGVDVLLVRRLQGEAQARAQTRADDSGRFEFTSVPEGEFHLITSGGAEELVEVNENDIAGLKLKPRPGVVVGTSVQMLDDGAEVRAAAELAPVFDRAAASRLRDTTLPGDYWPRLSGLGKELAVASVLLNNAPLPNGSFAIDGGAPQITFLVTSHFGTVTGMVGSGRATVVAIREPFSEYLDQSAQPRTSSDEKGAFMLRLVPGRYKVFALTGEEELLARNEKFLRRKAEAAESVEVGAESTCNITLP